MKQKVLQLDILIDSKTLRLEGELQSSDLFDEKKVTALMTDLLIKLYDCGGDNFEQKNKYQ